jgi:hypothetical protein
MLDVTHHAVERFIKYWRRGMPWLEARECLEALAARSSRTKRKTRRDADLRIATTERGERIPLVVRGRTVVTVLEAGCRDARSLGIVVEQQRTTLESVEAERARLAERVESECATRKAEAIVAAWWRGAFVRDKHSAERGACSGCPSSRCGNQRPVALEGAARDAVEQVVA